MLIGSIPVSVSVAGECGGGKNGANKNSKNLFHNIYSPCELIRVILGLGFPATTGELIKKLHFRYFLDVSGVSGSGCHGRRCARLTHAPAQYRRGALLRAQDSQKRFPPSTIAVASSKRCGRHRIKHPSFIP